MGSIETSGPMVEHIHTFTCQGCKNWWTYPTMHDDLPHYLKEGRWTCPHCAVSAEAGPHERS